MPNFMPAVSMMAEARGGFDSVDKQRGAELPMSSAPFVLAREGSDLA